MLLVRTDVKLIRSIVLPNVKTTLSAGVNALEKIPNALRVSNLIHSTFHMKDEAFLRKFLIFKIAPVKSIVSMVVTTVTIRFAVVRLVLHQHSRYRDTKDGLPKTSINQNQPVCLFYFWNELISEYFKVVEENPDWNRCIDENSLTLGRCVHSCENNVDCEQDCVIRFKTRQVNCPCEVLMIFIS